MAENNLTLEAPLSEAAEVKTAPRITEDWWAVILGGIIIFAIIALNGGDIAIHLPSYQWSSLQDLGAKVLATVNLLRIGATGLVFLALASISVALSGKSV